MASGSTTTLDDERYPTPPPRTLARLVELPFAAVVWTIERLLGVAQARSRGLLRRIVARRRLSH
jgi:hypothetical protein